MFGRRTLLGVIVAALIGLNAACDGSSTELPTQPTEPPPQGPADLQITDVIVGEGTEVVNGSQVSINYALWRYDPAGPESKGEGLQSSSFQFIVGQTGTQLSTIPGLNQGAIGTKVGGQRRLIIPPNLAYGSTGSGSIRPNEWIVFEFQVLQSISPAQ